MAEVGREMIREAWPGQDGPEPFGPLWAQTAPRMIGMAGGAPATSAIVERCAELQRCWSDRITPSIFTSDRVRSLDGQVDVPLDGPYALPDPFPQDEPSPRLPVGRAVLRRETLAGGHRCCPAPRTAGWPTPPGTATRANPG